MGNIVLLDDLTINKIAAGEVIERPASVVKEMVENSIDAGATNITVEIKNGGISYIRITDNGKGIPEDDLEIAFERHATSKIRSADDLNTVTSMGFRGEALASITAISKVELVSKTQTQQNGFKVVVEGGDILEKTEVGCPIGTSITVTNLFYNTPVRYKFLKKDFTEAGYIEDVVTRIALVHPEIAIKLVNTGKTVIQTNGNGDIKTVIYSIYGKDVAGALIETEYTYEDMHVYGVIGKPEIARSNRSNQIFFVNKRYVKDKSLSSAAERAYKGMIPIGRFSFLVLNIDMNPAKVDVNVHPAKLEVRFEEENIVFKAVYHAIKDALSKIELVANTTKAETETREESPLFGTKIPESKIPEIEKSQEILRKIQEMKEKLLNEKYEPKVENVEPQKPEISTNIENQENKFLNDSNLELNHEQKVVTEENSNENQYTSVKQNTSNEEISYVSQNSENQNINEEQKEYSYNQENNEQIVTQTEEIPQEQPKIDLLEEIAKAGKRPIDLKQELEKALEKPEENIIEDIMKEKIDESPESFEEMYQKLFGTKPIQDTKEQKEENFQTLEDIANTSMFENIKEYQKPVYKLVGIAFKTFIIIEIEKDMYIIDQHAAHERILYEKVKANYYNNQGPKESQLMLLPDIITLSHKEMEIARDNMEMFRKAGFIIEEFGENTLKLTGVPEMCIDLETKELFMETLDEINSISRTAKQEIEERFIATVACKAAVKANMDLTPQEVDSLITQLLSLPNPFTCPHGRPTAIKMSKYDIEKKFARIM